MQLLMNYCIIKLYFYREIKEQQKRQMIKNNHLTVNKSLKSYLLYI